MHALPRTGLLSFFYAHDEEGESFWQDPDYVRAYHFAEIETLQSRETPAAVRLGATMRVALTADVDVPPWPWDQSALARWPTAESMRDAYWEFRSELHPTGAYLLGYPFNTTLAYDPTPGPDWCSLLTLPSNDDLEWSWHDGDYLVAFIEKERLRQREFSRIKADAG